MSRDPVDAAHLAVMRRARGAMEHFLLVCDARDCARRYREERALERELEIDTPIVDLGGES